MSLELDFSSETEEVSNSSSSGEVKTRQFLSDNLIKALMANDVDQLKSLREAGESFRLCDQDGNSLLHLAVMSQAERSAYTITKRAQKFSTTHNSRKEAFNYLVTLPEVPKYVRNSRNATVLMEVFTYLQNDPEWAVKLIEAGYQMYEPFSDGNSCLHWAIENEWIEVAELLIEKGFDVNLRNKEETPLFLACRYGLVDAIWMLLFYGADPNKFCLTEGVLLYSNSKISMVATCFDVAVGQFVIPEVQEIMFNQLPGCSKYFSLLTIMETMKNNPETFRNLIEVADDINSCNDELQQLCDEFSHFEPELFRLFIEKFDYVVIHMFHKFSLAGLLIKVKDQNKLRRFTENMFTIFESPLVGEVIDILNSDSDVTSSSLRFLMSNFRNSKEHLDIITQLICGMLSYGLTLTGDTVEAVFLHFGYCDLFKMMLHMEIENINTHYTDLVPRMIYDVAFNKTSFITYCKRISGNCRETLHGIFDYFASPKLVESCKERRKLLREWLGEFEDADENDLYDVSTKNSKTACRAFSNGAC